MSKTISSPNSGLTLPPELLWEMVKFMSFEGLRQCCQTNFQLNALTQSAAMKMKQKLEGFYLGDIRLLAAWFRCWMVKNWEIHIELLQQCYRVKKAKKNATPQESRQLFIRMTSLLEEFSQSLDQISDKMAKVIKAKLNPSSGHFHLSRVCRLLFAERRRNLMEKTFLAPMQLYESMRQWGEVFWSCQFHLTTDFSQELATCAQGIYQCEQRTHDCQKLMTRCANALLFPRCI